VAAGLATVDIRATNGLIQNRPLLRFERRVFMDMRDVIRQAVRQTIEEMIRTGEVVLPPDYAVEAHERVELLRQGKRQLKRLKRWKNPWGYTVYDVVVFGDILLIDDEGWYCVHERPTRKLIWGKHQHADVYELYEFCLHLSLLTDWKTLHLLPQDARRGIEWRITELIWATGQSANWELFARMMCDLSRAAELMKAISRSPL
jgi:hypothetical protein